MEKLPDPPATKRELIKDALELLGPFESEAKKQAFEAAIEQIATLVRDRYQSTSEAPRIVDLADDIDRTIKLADELAVILGKPHVQNILHFYERLQGEIQDIPPQLQEVSRVGALAIDRLKLRGRKGGGAFQSIELPAKPFLAVFCRKIICEARQGCIAPDCHNFYEDDPPAEKPPCRAPRSTDRNFVAIVPIIWEIATGQNKVSQDWSHPIRTACGLARHINEGAEAAYLSDQKPAEDLILAIRHRLGQDARAALEPPPPKTEADAALEREQLKARGKPFALSPETLARLRRD